MRSYISRGRRAARAGLARVVVAAALGVLPLAACENVTEPLLEAVDPDIINPENIRSAEGATGLYRGALERFRTITAGGESTWLFGGLLGDEWGTSSTFVQNDEVDLRNILTNNSQVTGMYRDINRVRTAADQAIGSLREWTPDSSLSMAEMYFARGFAEMQLAQDFCGAIPLSSFDYAGDSLVQRGPSTTEEVFQKAVASYDSALTLIGTATSTRATTLSRAVRIGRARALLGLGRFADAGAAVSGIPTSYSYEHTFALTSGSNTIWSQNPSSRRYLVGDSLEGNARNIVVRNNIPFFTLGRLDRPNRDPRVPSRYTVSSRGDTTRSQDGSTLSRTTSLYDRLTPIAVVNGIDARLIEAEAALQANNPTQMLSILNALRATPPTIGTVTPTAAQLPPLTLPATREGQIDLLFREKALWTFSRGQRLGDMRRLIRQYGRTQEQVFPVGPHYRGGEYGTDVNLPVPQQEEQNPAFIEANGRQMCDTKKA